MAPSSRMRTLAARWLTDTVRITSPTYTAPTRAQMADDQTTFADPETVCALVRGPSIVDESGVTVERTVRDLVVWVDADATPNAGDRCTIVTASDATLTGEIGTVVTVERDSVRAVRRMTVRLGNDT